MTGRLSGAATVHHGVMAGAMIWMVASMPMGAAAILLATYCLLAAVPWIYSAGRRRSAEPLCHAAMSIAMGLMMLMR